MKKCDKEAKRKCKDLIDNGISDTVKHKGVAVPMIRNKILDKNINMLIREIDASKNEEEAIKEKIAEKHKWINKEARNCFYGGVGNGTLKCVVRYNHHGRRNKATNNGLVSSKCPRCGSEENWEYVFLYSGISDLQNEYVNDMKTKLKKIASNEQEEDIISVVVADITNYIN